MTLRLLLLVSLGGAVGSGARFSLGWLISRVAGLSFPYGTLTVNLVGSFLLTLLVTALPGTEGSRAEWKLILGTGVLGGFTTYSAFNTEALAMLQAGQTSKAAGYLAATLAGCLLAGAAGAWAGRALA